MSVPLCLLTDELLHCLNNCQASWIFTTPALYKRVVEVAAKANVSIKVGLHVIHSSETLLVGLFSCEIMAATTAAVTVVAAVAHHRCRRIFITTCIHPRGGNEYMYLYL